MPAPLSPRVVRAALAGALDAATRLAAWLVLPLAALLFAQWPLRDLVGAWSREANDIAQWIFALYVAFAVRAATRARVHMATSLPVAAAPGARPRWRRALDRFGEALLVLPWAVFVLASGAVPTWQSVVGLEAFSDTLNPLYFVIRLSAWLLALGVLLEAMLALASPADAPERAPADGAGTGDAA
jgi:TRAP-type C4-dicarboxylate transport system permease small subunit